MFPHSRVDVLSPRRVQKNLLPLGFMVAINSSRQRFFTKRAITNQHRSDGWQESASVPSLASESNEHGPLFSVNFPTTVCSCRLDPVKLRARKSPLVRLFLSTFRRTHFFSSFIDQLTT